jgi:F420-dependent oxidoreductase-like protein
VRLSIQTPQYGTDLASLTTVWRAAAALGFRAAWLMDHLYPIMVPRSEPMLEAWTTLAALAARTDGLRVGILVSANTFRHPALLARMATTVDHVAEGRLEVGLGAAWCEPEHTENGLAFPALRDRLGMLDEACTVLRRLWTEPVVSFDGRYYRLQGAACAPKPVQRRLPLLVGGQGERRALRIVARHADRWNAAGDVETLSAKAAVLRRHCAAIGRDPAEIALTVRNDFLLTDDAEAARAGVERMARFTRLPPDVVRRRLWIGDRAEVARGLAAFAAAGFDEAILALAPPYDAATITMLERTARDLMPALAAGA